MRMCSSCRTQEGNLLWEPDPYDPEANGYYYCEDSMSCLFRCTDNFNEEARMNRDFVRDMATIIGTSQEVIHMELQENSGYGMYLSHGEDWF